MVETGLKVAVDSVWVVEVVTGLWTVEVCLGMVESGIEMPVVV